MDQRADLLVLYDGDCGFCNRSVAFILKADRSSRIHFASIQSDFTKALFQKNGWPVPDLSTFYFVETDRLYSKSEAALQLAKYFSFPYNLLQFFFIVPRRIRDRIYDWVARRRSRFSKHFCVVPTLEQQARFVD